jgi:hypothetical protein
MEQKSCNEEKKKAVENSICDLSERKNMGQANINE